MFQIDQTTAASTLPTPAAANTQGYFTNGNPGSGVAATIVDADFLNMIMMELINVVEAGGLTPSKTTYTQVLSAIKRINQNTVVLTDNGAANAYAAANTPPLVAGTWTNGVTQQIVVAHTNTGASTYSPDTLTAIPIYGLGLQPLQGNEMFAGGTAILMKQTIAGVNSGNPICVLMECAGGAQQIPPASQPQHAAQLQQIGHGQCRLSVASATSLKLAPYNGNNLAINGVPQQIPAAGVTVSNTGLSASTVYYVYAAMSGGTMVLNLSTTGHSPASTGIETKTGDVTQTLVGMISTNASSQFVDAAATRFCLNWFNRRKLIGSAIGSGFTTTSTSIAEISASLRVSFLCWADDVPQQFLYGNISDNTASTLVSVAGYINGSQAGLVQSYVSTTANFGTPYSTSSALGLSEGSNLSAIYGSVGSASTGSFSCNHSVVVNG